MNEWNIHGSLLVFDFFAFKYQFEENLVSNKHDISKPVHFETLLILEENYNTVGIIDQTVTLLILIKN